MLQNAPTLAIVAVDTDENEPSKVRQVTNRIRHNIGRHHLHDGPLRGEQTKIYSLLQTDWKWGGAYWEVFSLCFWPARSYQESSPNESRTPIRRNARSRRAAAGRAKLLANRPYWAGPPLSAPRWPFGIFSWCSCILEKIRSKFSKHSAKFWQNLRNNYFGKKQQKISNF